MLFKKFFFSPEKKNKTKKTFFLQIKIASNITKKKLEKFFRLHLFSMWVKEVGERRVKEKREKREKRRKLIWPSFNIFFFFYKLGGVNLITIR